MNTFLKFNSFYYFSLKKRKGLNKTKYWFCVRRKLKTFNEAKSVKFFDK